MSISRIVRAESPLFPSKAYTFPCDGEYYIGRAQGSAANPGLVLAVFTPDMNRLAEVTSGHAGHRIVSRQHALIRVGPCPTIDDCDSYNGLFYIPSGEENGEAMKILRPFNLVSGANLICFGNNEYRMPFRLHVGD